MIILVINDAEQLLESLVFLSDFFFFFLFDARKEHISHSPSCHFIALKKNVEELSVEEFVKLQMERQKFFVVCTFRYASDVASNVISCRVNAIPTCFSHFFFSPNLFPGSITPVSFRGFPLRTRALTVASSLIQISFPLFTEQIQ